MGFEARAVRSVERAHPHHKLRRRFPGLLRCDDPRADRLILPRHSQEFLSKIRIT